MARKSDVQKRIKRDQADTDRRIDQLVSQLKRFMDSALEEIVNDIIDGQVDPALALGGLIEAFRAKGLSNVIGELSTLYGAELGKVLNTLKAQSIPATLQTVDGATLEALINFRVEDIQNKAIETIGRLRPIILENIVSGTRPDIKALSARVDSQLVAQTKTELNTALISFNRTVTASAASELGIERFIYVGPDDGITRPFCQSLLNDREPPIYTIDEIAAMDNDQGLDVLTSGGGYNCRHTWQPVSDDLAKELGA